MVCIRTALLLVAASASALYATPELRISATQIGPINVPQNGTGPTQTVTASNIGDGTLNLTVSASASWLSPSVVDGTSIRIALDTSGLAPGSYTEFVTVSAPGAIDAPQTISCSIIVSGLPAQIQFYASPTGASVRQLIAVGNNVNTQVSTTNGGSWLTAPSDKGFLSYYPFQITANPQPVISGTATPLIPADYNGTVTLSGSPVPTENGTINVVMHVTNNPILQFGSSSLQLYAGAGGSSVVGAVGVSNVGQGILSVTGATGSASWLTATTSGNNTITVTANPAGLTTGVYNGAITLTSNAANASSTTLPVELFVEPTAAPILSFGGVIDNASGQSTLSPGMISSAYGVELAAATAGAASLPLNTTLGGVQVSVNGISAPVYYASANQVNFVVPWSAQAGAATITVTSGGLTSNPVSATIASIAPRLPFLPLGTRSLEYALAQNPDGTLAVPPAIGALFGATTHAAKIGTTIVVYALGLGQTDQEIADGVASPVSPLANARSTAAFFGGAFSGVDVPGTVIFSGLTPGYVGLYQINVTIPASAPTGDAVGLQLNVAGVTSNVAYLSISN